MCSFYFTTALPTIFLLFFFSFFDAAAGLSIFFAAIFAAAFANGFVKVTFTSFVDDDDVNGDGVATAASPSISFASEPASATTEASLTLNGDGTRTVVCKVAQS
jgi:hypothetical protein